MKRLFKKGFMPLLATAISCGVIFSSLFIAFADGVQSPVKATDFDYKVMALDATAASEGGTLTKVVGDYATFVEGSGADAIRYSGTVTFKSMHPITDYNFTTLVSKVNWGGTITFAASKDGTAWENLTVVTASTEDYGGSSWNGTYNDNYGTLNAADGYYYLRAVLTATDNGALAQPRYPSIAYLEYNSSAPSKAEMAAASYKTKKLATEGIIKSDTENVILSTPNTTSLFGGYYVFEKADQASNVTTSYAGSINYSSVFPITDIHISLTRLAALEAVIEVSKDGTVWEKVTCAEVADPTATIKWGGYKSDLYASLPAAYGYYHLRVNLPANDVGIPAMAFIEYNCDIQKPDNYLVKANATEGTISSATEGVELSGPNQTSLYNGYYVFEKPEQTGTETYAGSVTFSEINAITDLHISLTRLASLKATVELSKDGKVWEAVELAEVADSTATIKWGGFKSDLYIKLDVKNGYHYVRVNLPANNVGVPALAFIEYNFDLEIPEKYEVKVYSENATAKGEADSASYSRELSGGETCGYTLFKKTENGTVTDTGAAGSLIFSSEYPITDFHIHLIKCTLDNMKETVEISKDGNAWEAINLAEKKGVAFGNNSWHSYFSDLYGSLPATAGYKHIRITLPANPWGLETPAVGYLEYTREGEPSNVETPLDGPLPESDDIADLKLPSKKTLFSEKKTDSMFKANNMGISPNGTKNSPYFGVTHSLAAQAANDTWFIMYTPNVRDFKFTMSCTTQGYKLVIKAYGRTSQYSEEVQIPLIRTADIRPESKGEGTPWYQFRVANRDALAKNYEYIRIEIVDSLWTQCMDFTFFYEGEEPGPIPDDEQPHILDSVGTEREGVQSICPEQGNFRAELLEHMAITGNGNNAGFIGCKRGALVYPDDKKDGTAIFKTEAIDKFWVKFCVGLEELTTDFVVKFYVASTIDAPESEWTEISAHIEECIDSRKPTGWKAIEFVSDTDAVFPAGSNYLKIFLPAKENNYKHASAQIARIDYTYSIPEGEKLPEFKKPNTDKGEQEILDDFSGSQLLEAEGGLAYDADGVEWMQQSLGSYNGSDKVYYKKDFVDAYIIYNAPGITGIDIRGYRHADAVEDILVYVSADGEKWVELTDFKRRDVTLYGGPINYSHLIEKVPEGMDYVKIMFPEFAGELTDITISDIQILYNESLAADGATATNIPWVWIIAGIAAAVLVLAGIGITVFIVLRKRSK